MEAWRQGLMEPAIADRLQARAVEDAVTPPCLTRNSTAPHHPEHRIQLIIRCRCPWAAEAQAAGSILAAPPRRAPGRCRMQTRSGAERACWAAAPTRLTETVGNSS